MKKTMFSVLFGLVCCFIFEAKGVVILDNHYLNANAPEEEDVFAPVDQMVHMIHIACEKIQDACLSYKQGDYIKMVKDIRVIGAIGGVFLVALPFMYVNFSFMREGVHTCLETAGAIVIE